MKNQTFVFSRIRNTKIAFLIDNDIPIPLLRKLMTDNYKIWGGTYNPIIPVHGNLIQSEWADVLEQIDPDIIYHSESFDPQAIQNLGLKIYPRIFKIIPENGMINLTGVNSLAFINSFFKYNLEDRRHVSFPYFVAGLDHTLKDFLSLNFGVREIFIEDDEYLQDIRKTGIYKDNIHDALSLMWSRSGFMPNILCNFYVGNEILDTINQQSSRFELIIYDDDNCFKDLIYFWNRKLYQTPSRKLQQVIVSRSQFQLLANDPFFHWVLSENSGRENIYVSSRSITDKELNQLFDLCKKGNIRAMFTIVKTNIFPEKYIRIEPSSHQYWIKNIFKGDEDFINLPEFPLGEHIRIEGVFEVDVRINNMGSYEFSTFRFPNYSVIKGDISNVPGRVNKYNALSFHLEKNVRGIDLRIPSVSSIISSRLQIRDHAGKIERPFGLNQCTPSRAGLLLSAFLKLFKNDWTAIECYVLDKFWLEVFTGTGKYQKIKEVWPLTEQWTTQKYSSLSKLNLYGKFQKGDGLFSFKDLQHELKCIYNKYFREIIAKSEDKESGYEISDLNSFALMRYNDDAKLLLNHLSILVKLDAIFIGLKVKCDNCGSKLWYSLKELNSLMICRGCSFDIKPEPESHFFYKVNDTILNNLMSDPIKRTKSFGGNYIVLEALNYLREGHHGNVVTSFGYAPSQDIYVDHKDFKKTDLDILALQNGKLIVGEAKLNSSELDDKQIKQLIWIGNEIRPDIILIVYKNGNLKETIVEKIRKGITHPNVHVQLIKIEEAIFRFGAMSWLK